MGYNMHDLKNGVDQFHDKIRQRQEAKGEELGNRLYESTMNGRGLWVLLLWPVWFLLMAMTMSLISSPFIDEFTLSHPSVWVGMAVGYFAANAWYNWGFTLRHPFWSSMFTYFGYAIAIMVIFGVPLTSH